MAQQLSTRLTNATTVPLVVGSFANKNGLASSTDTVEVAAGSNNDTAILNIRIPVDARITSVRVASDDLGTAGTMSIGLFAKDNMAATFTAVSAACIAATLDVNAAAVGFTERRFSAPNIDTVNKAAWELAGLSAKPTTYGDFYLGLTFPTATTAVGTVSVIVDMITTGG